jgi:hypothetical protein
LLERLTLNELGCDEVNAIRLADFMNRDYVWVIE